jgi:predicted enzyme related to lactoylglutathione lyase
VDGRAAGGIGEMDEGWGDLPPYWNTYFKVEDTDEACAEVRRLAGKVLREPWDTPFGRIAAVMDDQGASSMLLADVTTG